MKAGLRENGFVDDPLGENGEDLKALWHPEAMLPRVLLAATNVKYPPAIAIRPEFVAEFAAVHGITNAIEGEPLSRFRKLLAFEENDADFYAIERRGYRGYLTQKPDLEEVSRRARALADAPPALGWRREGLRVLARSFTTGDRSRRPRSRLSSRF